MTNCKNCGAPLHGSRCEYYGTEYPVNVAYDNKVTVQERAVSKMLYKINSDGSISDYCEDIENCPIIW